MAGSSLRLARSPVPPKMTSVVGWTGSRSSPSTSGFSCVWSTVAIALLRVRLALRHRVGRLHGVAAELVAKRGVHLRREGVLAPRGEALEERRGDDGGRDAL